jgi:hypothetical protein
VRRLAKSVKQAGETKWAMDGVHPQPFVPEILLDLLQNELL